MKCKDHGRPITSVDELNLLLTRRTGDDLRKWLHQEVGVRKAMHPFDAKERPALYKMNFLKSEQLIENFMILLDPTGSENEDESALFPSEDEIMSILNENSCDNVLLWTPSDTQAQFKLQQPLAIIWDKVNGDRYWCIGFVMGIDDGKIHIDHQQPSSQHKSLTKLIRPQTDDVQDVILDQIIPVDIYGQWDLQKRQPTFILRNRDSIVTIFEENFI